MAEFKLDAKSTALVLIDLQNGIAGRPLQPYTGAEVVSRAAALAAAFREHGGTVVYVHVKLDETLTPTADKSMRDPNAPPPPATASELVPESGYQDQSDLLITKRQWGAFYGTELDQQLRRRGIKTIAIGGIATNFGVESTARAAFDQGYEIVFVEDASTSISAAAHAFSMDNIFPYIGRVRRSKEVTEALSR